MQLSPPEPHGSHAPAGLGHIRDSTKSRMRDRHQIVTTSRPCQALGSLRDTALPKPCGEHHPDVQLCTWGEPLTEMPR